MGGIRFVGLYTAEPPWPDPESLGELEDVLRKQYPDAAHVVAAYRSLCSMPGNMAAQYVIALRRAVKRRKH